MDISKIAISLSTWIFMYIGLIAVRAELHPWVNTIILTVLYPMYMWYMTRNNIIGVISQGSMFAMVIGATLFMTLLLEAMPKSKFSTGLKKSLKEYGKKPADTLKASIAVAVSLIIGAMVSYAVTSTNFVES
tara:strand:- start:315 stop:710 length:396 start_codon:yes stop_codon:yes gene_type:complete